MKKYTFVNNGDYKTLYLLNEQTGWVVRADGLYQTADSGLSWQLINTGGQFNFSSSGVVFFENLNHGFVADATSVGATINGGVGWNKIYSGESVYHDVHFLDDNIGYVTDGQYILKTVDGGATWKKEVVVPGVQFFELHFTDKNHGWACGSGGTVLKFAQ